MKHVQSAVKRGRLTARSSSSLSFSNKRLFKHQKSSAAYCLFGLVAMAMNQTVWLQHNTADEVQCDDDDDDGLRNE